MTLTMTYLRPRQPEDNQCQQLELHCCPLHCALCVATARHQMKKPHLLLVMPTRLLRLVALLMPLGIISCVRASRFKRQPLVAIHLSAPSRTVRRPPASSTDTTHAHFTLNPTRSFISFRQLQYPRKPSLPSYLDLEPDLVCLAIVF